MKKILSAFVRVIISFGLLGLLFWLMRDDIADIWSTVSKSSLRFVGFSLVLIVLNVAMLAYRLKIIFLGENLKITLKQALQLTFVGYFFNNFMPTAVGGDIIKAHYASCANGKKIQSYASVLMDRLLGLYTFLIVAGIALIVDGGRFHLESIKLMVFVFLILGIVGFIIATNKKIAELMEKTLLKMKMFRIGERLHGIYTIVHDYRNRRDVILKSLAVSIFAQCVYFSVIYIFFFALGVQVSPGNIFLIMPVVTFISMIPSVGGLGVREGALVLFFAPITGREAAFAVSLLLLFALLFISVIGGIIYLWWSVRRERVNVGSDE